MLVIKSMVLRSRVILLALLMSAVAVLPSTDSAVAAESNSFGVWFVSPSGVVSGDPSFGDAIGDDFRAKTIEAAPLFDGYWIMSETGEVQAFGTSVFYGDLAELALDQPPVDMVATASGLGYWIVAADGGVFAFGDAGFYGSLGGLNLVRPIVAIASTSTGNGYWLFAADGGVFAFGDAGFHGSLPQLVHRDDLVSPIATASRSAGGAGYLMVGSDGGVFAFGDAGYRGGFPELPLVVDAGINIVSIVVGSNGGYYLVDDLSGFYGFDVFQPTITAELRDLPTVDAAGFVTTAPITATIKLPTDDPIHPAVDARVLDRSGNLVAEITFEDGWEIPDDYTSDSVAVATGASMAITLTLPNPGIYTFELDPYRSSPNGSLMAFVGRAGGSAVVRLGNGSVVSLPAGPITSTS